MPGPSTAGLPGEARAHLVARVRTLLGSLSGGYTDDEIRAYLDENLRSADGWLKLLGWSQHHNATVAVYAATLGNWDEGWSVDPIPPGGIVADDLIAGRWRVEHAPVGWNPLEAIRVQGVIYDIYGTAADALQRDAASRVVQFTTTGGESISTADSADLISTYRSRSWAASVVLDRGDLMGDDYWPGTEWGVRWT